MIQSQLTHKYHFWIWKKTGPIHFIASTLGAAVFCQVFMTFQNNVIENVMRRQKQFIAERQRTYVGESRTFRDKLYEDLVKQLEEQQQQQQEGISRENAERILRAMEQDEKQLQEKMNKQKEAQPVRIEKNW